MAKSSSQKQDEDLLAATRKRAARIDRYVDMIPARFYLPSEALQAHKPRSGLDPAQYKPTSQLLAEILTAAAAPATASSAGKGKNKKAKKQAAAASEKDAPSSRGELRGRLERRIAELKEERRRKQSDADKAKAASTKAAQSPKVSAKAVPEEGSQSSAKRKGRTESSVADDVEAGRLSFEPRSSDLPFEAGVNRRGTKVKQLRQTLRKEEAKRRKLQEAEERGDGDKDQLRQDMALDMALRRARGEKVHDDISRLRKQQKQLELKKTKGKEQWKAREDERVKKSEEQQQKRKDNLKARREKKKEKKGGKARGGFEGQKTGYLNKEK